MRQNRAQAGPGNSVASDDPVPSSARTRGGVGSDGAGWTGGRRTGRRATVANRRPVARASYAWLGTIAAALLIWLTMLLVIAVS